MNEMAGPECLIGRHPGRYMLLFVRLERTTLTDVQHLYLRPTAVAEDSNQSLETLVNVGEKPWVDARLTFLNKTN